MRRFRAWYGANPLHLLALLVSFTVAGYAAARLVPDHPLGVAVWFVGAAVAHDLVLLPLYAVVDASMVRTSRRPTRLPPVPWLNHVRVPMLLSGLLLLVYLPSVLQLSGIYRPVTALDPGRFLESWLGVTAGLFVVSAVAYAVRLRRYRSSQDRADRDSGAS